MGAPRHRAAAIAIFASLAVHAAVLVGLPAREDAPDEGGARYVATLTAMAAAVPAAVPQPATRPARRARPARRLARPGPAVAGEVLAALPAGPSDAGEAPLLGTPELAPAPELLALALPAVPLPQPPAAFPVEALPASLAIDYALTSSFADGRATYRWEREGDRYRITGEAEAVGFFTLFLEGRIVQESHGTVTAAGLRPERFSEQRPGAAEEGVDFDWEGRRVTFDRKGERRSAELAAETVDWLSMIFQLAHRPPQAQALPMQVFTQRKLYRFDLKVLGVEEIEIPLGVVRALHLRHEDPKRDEVVDVWLGVEQHYLPVKLRFPAARNRLVVEQVATRVHAEASP